MEHLVDEPVLDRLGGGHEPVAIDVLEHPLDGAVRVDRTEAWETLTDPSELAEWFANDVELDVRPGGTGVFRWDDGDGACAGAADDATGVSKHLDHLAHVGLARGSREGRRTVYHADLRPLRLAADWLERVGGQWDDRLGALRRHADERRALERQ